MKAANPTAFGPQAIWAGKLVNAAIVFLAVEVAILFLARQIFLSSARFSQSVHDWFVRVDESTAALQYLKTFYEQPVDGIAFSQVFGIYLSICLSLVVFLLIVGAAAATGVMKSERFRGRAARSYIISFTLFGIGIGVFGLFLFDGPSSPNDRGLFGQDFISSMCMLVPMGQFLILVGLILCFVAANPSRNNG